MEPCLSRIPSGEGISPLAQKVALSKRAGLWSGAWPRGRRRARALLSVRQHIPRVADVRALVAREAQRDDLEDALAREEQREDLIGQHQPDAQAGGGVDAR